MLLPARLLLLLVLVDLLLVGAHVYSARLTASHLDTAWLGDHRWRVDSDRGVAESFQYLKYLAVAGLALLVYRRRAFRSAVVLAAFALVLLADDSLRIHERVGGYVGAVLLQGSSVAGATEPALVLTAKQQSIGELAFWLVHGLVFLAYLLLASRSGPGPERALAGRVAALVAVLALFGAVVDALAGSLIFASATSLIGAGLEQVDTSHLGLLLAFPSMPEPFALVLGAAQVQALLATESIGTVLSQLRLLVVGLAVVEDGGEMIVLSLLVVSVWAAARALGPTS